MAQFWFTSRAATNHKELLDPAVWLRFEMIFEFPMPTLDEVRQTIDLHLKNDREAMRWSEVLSQALNGFSYAEVERELMQIRRQTVLRGQPAATLIRRMVLDRMGHLDRKDRTAFALKLMEAGLSQRETHEWTGVSRDTIRKAVREEVGTWRNLRTICWDMANGSLAATRSPQA